jgi:hypothetical protein
MSELINFLEDNIDFLENDNNFLEDEFLFSIPLNEDLIVNILNFYLSNSIDKYYFSNVIQTVTHIKWIYLLKIYVKNMNEKIFFSEGCIHNFICFEFNQYLEYVNALININDNDKIKEIYTLYNIKYNLFNFIRIFKKIYNIA